MISQGKLKPMCDIEYYMIDDFRANMIYQDEM